ncbi:tellurite resistance TerB C-terminal domain-containing protein [Sphingobacterium thalpophilum]|uniref:Tellurite resistance TerB C-terminal domain-containing protein n=1 Tax=Sphingobacterium thalpophilum TaxID=259 RepID=A0ABV4HNK8_9SPHI
MGTFFIILIFILIAVAASSKKNKKRQKQQYYAPREAQEQPTAGEMKSANLYYGESWRQYLIINHGKYELWPLDFFEIAAIALRKLPINEQYDLKIAFSDKDGALLLYNLTLRLLRNRQYNSENICKAYRMVIDNFQKQLKDSQQDKAKSPPIEITNKEDIILDNTTPIYRSLPPEDLFSKYKPVAPQPSESKIIIQDEESRSTKNIIENNATPSSERLSNENLNANDGAVDREGNDLNIPIQVQEIEANQQDHREIESILDALVINSISDRKEANNAIIDITDQQEEIISNRDYDLEKKMSYPSLDPLDIDDILVHLNSSNLFAVKEETTSNNPTQDSNLERFENGYSYEDYLLGNRYKEKMRLSKAQVALVNKLTGVSNVFIEVEGCCIETITLFLSCIKKLKATLTKRGTDLKIEIENLSDTARKINKETRDGEWLFQDYYGPNHVNDYFTKQVYYTIFKRAENLVREQWKHKRKISADFIQYFKGLSDIFERRIGTDVNLILENLRPSIKDPDKPTEIELNRLNVRRWMFKFDAIKNGSNNENIADFVRQVHKLFEDNQQNPSAENIYYEACKVAYPIDKHEAIRLYLHYVNADLLSDKIDGKELTKTIYKALFKNDQHEQAFNDIIRQLKEDRDLTAAIEKVDLIYAPVRKKIELNIETIKMVQQQDKNTVELLNNYLQDEEELVEKPTIVYSTRTEKPTIDKETFEAEPDPANLFIDEIDLALHHREIIVEFTRSEFTLTQEQISNYCAAKGLRSGPIINDINERCYELLDDNLIEERDDEYLDMNEDYYKMIVKA